jgi:hypothetical protein
MNFGELKAHLLALIGREPSDLCYTLVTADINAALRIAAMEDTATLVEAASVTLPADFLAMVSAYRDTATRTPLRPTTAQAINNTHQASGTPSQYAIVDGAMLLNPEPDGTENIVIRYYAKQADLVDDADTTAVLTKHPAIYVYGALAHHAQLIRNMEAAAIWQGQYVQAVKGARASDSIDRHSGAPLEPSVRVAP